VSDPTPGRRRLPRSVAIASGCLAAGTLALFSPQLLEMWTAWREVTALREELRSSQDWAKSIGIAVELARRRAPDGGRYLVRSEATLADGPYEFARLDLFEAIRVGFETLDSAQRLTVLNAIQGEIADEDVAFRRCAMRRIERWAHQAQFLLSSIRRALSDPDNEVACLAARALCDLDGAFPAEALPRITSALELPDSGCRLLASGILEVFPAEASACLESLVACLERDAADGLGGIRPAKRLVAAAREAALPHLSRLLEHERILVRLDAVRTLGLMAPEAGPVVVPALLSRLKDDRIVRIEALKALGRFGRHALLVLGPAQAILEAPLPLREGNADAWSEEVRLKIAALQALAGLGPKAEGALQAICAYFGREPPPLSIWARVAAARVRSEQSAAALWEISSELSGRFRESACEGLLALGPDASELAPSLCAEAIRALSTMGAGTGWELWEPYADAVRALGASDQDLSKIAGHLEGASAERRRLVAMFLARLGPVARPVAGVLVSLLRDLDGGTRLAAVTALGPIARLDSSVRPAIEMARRDVDAEVRWEALRILQELDAPKP